jgi:hypothetical protein
MPLPRRMNFNCVLETDNSAELNARVRAMLRR